MFLLTIDINIRLNILISNRRSCNNLRYISPIIFHLSVAPLYNHILSLECHRITPRPSSQNLIRRHSACKDNSLGHNFNPLDPSYKRRYFIPLRRYHFPSAQLNIVRLRRNDLVKYYFESFMLSLHTKQNMKFPRTFIQYKVHSGSHNTHNFRYLAFSFRYFKPSHIFHCYIILRCSRVRIFLIHPRRIRIL